VPILDRKAVFSFISQANICQNGRFDILILIQIYRLSYGYEKKADSVSLAFELMDYFVGEMANQPESLNLPHDRDRKCTFFSQ
jgi:hypothetical protein